MSPRVRHTWSRSRIVNHDHGRIVVAAPLRNLAGFGDVAAASARYRLRLASGRTRGVTLQGTVAVAFDPWAPSYDDSALQPMFEAAHAAVLRRLGRLGVRPDRILDVGCGTGRLLRTASGLFPRAVLVGVDASGGMLMVAAATTPAAIRVRVVQATAEHLPFPAGVFDVVTSTLSVRHWADQHAGMKEIRRVLAPGGLLGFAEILPIRRRGVMARVGRRASAALPVGLNAALISAGLGIVGVNMVGGFGPINEITVVVARRHGRCGS